MPDLSLNPSQPKESRHFIQNIIDEDLREKPVIIKTRFPPEPNGYLHIGHAKSICLNFGLAQEYRGICHLRFDDTNPSKENVEYINSIQEDVRWLGFDWGKNLFYASDYFERLYDFAVSLIKAEKAYVCHLNAEEIRQYRGTLTEPGRESPYSSRSVEENLDLFARMKNGDFDNGSCTLRARIDMASGNLNMRDPVLYRVLKVSHHRTGNTWNIYPMYDFTHCLSDALEGITHSICTLEFEDHRPLYDWVLDNLPVPCHPKQIEFARLNLSHTLTSKRKLLELIEKGLVSGWDDPRLPTISGIRRRGYTPESIRDFCDRIGVAKRESLVDMALLEHCLREELNKTAQRIMAVLNPLKVVIQNYSQEGLDEMEAVNNPEDPDMGTRTVLFSKVIYIERDDFMEDPPRKFFRLAPGREVRLRYGYFITCTDVVKDPDTGEITELRCTYDPKSKGGNSPDGRKVKATLHWVSAEHCLNTEVRLYDHLITAETPSELKKDQNIADIINPNSLKVLSGCKIEPYEGKFQAGTRFQFERQGYFCVDKDSKDGYPVFNRIVTLKDAWARILKSSGTD